MTKILSINASTCDTIFKIVAQAGERVETFEVETYQGEHTSNCDFLCDGLYAHDQDFEEFDFAVIIQAAEKASQDLRSNY